MRKKNIGFILFGIAGMEIISSIISFFVFPRIYERLGISSSYTRFVFIGVFEISLITAIILIVVGIILLIKFRNE